MEIKNIDKGLIDKLSPRVAREETPAEPRPRTEQASDRPEPKAVAPKRPPPLLATVSRSLAQSGLEVASTETTPSAAEPDQETLANQSETEARQAERAAEALQSFMHSLVKAVTTEETAPSGSLAETNIPGPSAQLADTARPMSTAASAYEGLVSRLEGLIQGLSGDQPPSRSNQELARLDSAFRDLLSVSATGKAGAGPDLQTVLKNIVRNLQSTGDPTLASTGNVINTSA